MSCGNGNYQDWCEVCANGWRDDFLSTKDHQDVCPHWRSELQNQTPVSHEKSYALLQPVPFDEDPSHKMDNSDLAR